MGKVKVEGTKGGAGFREAPIGEPQTLPGS
jgi:hypothetical protein